MGRDAHPRPQTVALVVVDALALLAALHGAIWLRYDVLPFELLPFAKEVGATPWREIFLATPVLVGAWLAALGTLGGYGPRPWTAGELAAVLRAAALTGLVTLAASVFYLGFSYSRGMLALFVLLLPVCAVVGRLAFRALRRRVLSRFGGRARVAVVGQGKVAETLAAALRRRDDHVVVGRVATHEAGGHLPEVLGHVRDVDEICRAQRLDMLVLAERGLADEVVLETVEACMRHHVTWSMVPSVHELFVDRARVDLVDGIPLVGMRRSAIVGFNWMLKRAFDLVMAVILLTLLAPVMLIVAVLVRLSSEGPILHVQQRVGYRGRVFPFFKFRSMHLGHSDEAHREYVKTWITDGRAHGEDNGRVVHKIVVDPRVFPVGAFIRKHSLDELPQLLNVLRGDMSLVGPRPALPYEVEMYREWHRRRFEAPPGMTGLWQVSGRNRLSFEEMVELDVDYLESWSMVLDLQILWRTVRVVLFEHAY